MISPACSSRKLSSSQISVAAESFAAAQFALAGFDVLEKEPPTEGHPLLDIDLPNFIMTPHIAWSGREAMQMLADQLIANIESFVAGAPQNRVV